MAHQKAMKEFLDLTYDDAMMDRWIPDEDWVQQMRLNRESDCSIMNLNKGLEKQCVFENNNAILQGTTGILITTMASGDFVTRAEFLNFLTNSWNLSYLMSNDSIRVFGWGGNAPWKASPLDFGHGADRCDEL